MNKPLFHLVGAVVLLIVALVLYGVWYGVVSAQSAQDASIQQQLNEKNLTTAQTVKAKAELASLTSDESTINQYFVSTNGVVAFLSNLQTTGKYLGSSVQVESVSATPGTPYGNLSLSLSITGSFNAVLKTIGAIEYGPYDTSVSSLTFDTTSGSTASSSQPWTANGTFSIGTQPGKTLIAPKTSAASTNATPAASASSSTSSVSSTSASTAPAAPSGSIAPAP